MSRPLDVATRVLTLAEADEVRVHATHQRHGLTRFAESHIHQHVGEDATHVSLTVVRDGRVAQASTTDTSKDGLARLVQRAQELAAAAPVDDAWPGLTGPANVQDPLHAAPDTVAANGDERAAVVEAFVTAGGANAAGYCETDVVTAALVDSLGGAAEQQRTRATLDGIHRLADGTAGAGHQTSRSLADLDGALAGVQARRLADLGAVTTEFTPGRFHVVLGPEAVGTIMIFLAAYGFNGKTHNEGQSGIHLAQAQFDPSLTLVDDPLADHALGIGFDHEGTARGRRELIRSGTSNGLSHDRRSGAEAGTDSTGHGAPGSTTYGPVAMDLTLSAAEGHSTVPVAQLAADMERGLIISAFNYCRVLDPKTIDVTGLTRNGTFLVEDGQIVGSVGNLRFTQSFLASFAPGSVVGIGDDGRYADCEFGAGMTWAPSLRLASWNITGDARG